MEAINQVLTAIGWIVVAGGGLSFIVFQVFKHLGAKWLDARFEERLQALKHEQGKEIEELRFKISAILDRTVKLHQREFEILPEAWSKLNDAFWEIRRLVSSVQSYPDVDRMPGAQLEEFLTICSFSNWQKMELRDATNKNEVYQKHIFWHHLGDAQSKANDGYTYFVRNKIFIDHEIRAQLSVIHDLMWGALSEHQSNEQHGILPRQRQKIDDFLSNGEVLLTKLEILVHRRVWPVDRLNDSTDANQSSKV